MQSPCDMRGVDSLFAATETKERTSGREDGEDIIFGLSTEGIDNDESGSREARDGEKPDGRLGTGQ